MECRFAKGWLRVAFLALLAIPVLALSAGVRTVAGFTFASDRSSLYVSARDVSESLGVPLQYDSRSDLAFLGSIPLDYRSAVGELRFVKIAALTNLGVNVQRASPSLVKLRLKGRELDVQSGLKRAVVDKTHQQLRVYQGGELVLTSRVSTGKYTGSTPDGTFRVGYTKDAYHSSAKYDDAPMPWAVHVTGNVFIHGGNVPDYPASHGCVRLPADAAEWFYNWVEPGTVVKIQG